MPLIAQNSDSLSVFSDCLTFNFFELIEKRSFQVMESTRIYSRKFSRSSPFTKNIYGFPSNNVRESSPIEDSLDFILKEDKIKIKKINWIYGHVFEEIFCEFSFSCYVPSGRRRSWLSMAFFFNNRATIRQYLECCCHICSSAS